MNYGGRRGVQTAEGDYYQEGTQQQLKRHDMRALSNEIYGEISIKMEEVAFCEHPHGTQTECMQLMNNSCGGDVGACRCP